MATITDFDPNNFEVLNDFDPNDFEVVDEYRPSRGALELELDFLRQQEQEPDQRSFFDAVAIGANRGLAGLQSSVGGLFNLVGLPDFGDVWQQAARQREQGMADVSGTLAGQNPNLGLEWAEHASAIAPQQLPTVAAGAFGGVPLAMLMAGLQTAGSTQDAAQRAYESQGLAREEAISRSRMPALTSGAITALLTGLVPGRWGEGITTTGGRTAVQQAKQSVYETARRIFTEAAKEAPEEIIDELAQGAVAKFSYDPDRPMSEILMDAWEAGGWGAATAGAVGTVGMAANALTPRSEIRDYLDAQRNQSVEDFAESEPHFRDTQGAVSRYSSTDPNSREVFDPDNYEVVNAPVRPTAPATPQVDEVAAMQEFQNPPPRVQQPAAPAEFWPDDFEVIDEPPTFEFSPAPEASAPSAVQPIEATEQVRNLLLTNMQGRSMDISPESFATPDTHIISVLGQKAPSWQQLAQAGIVQATPNANGTVNVRVAPVEASVIHSESSITPTPVETTQPAVPAPLPVAALPQPTPALPTPTPIATGPEISNLIQRSPLSPKVKRVATALINSPAMKGLNFSNLQVELTKAAEGEPLTEVGARFGNLIELSDKADVKTLPHEVAHVLYDSLPDEVKTVIENARQAQLSSMPDVPDSVRSGTISSAAFKAANLPLEIYRLSNPSEFLASVFENKFTQQALAQADPTLIGKLKAWLTEMWDTIKNTLGLSSDMDRVVQDLIDGKYKPTPESGAQAEQTRQSTFVQTQKQAKSEEDLARDAADLKQSGESFLAQTENLVAFLEKHGGTSHAFDYNNIRGIRDIGERLNGGRADYRTLKAQITDQHQLNRIGAEAATHALRMIERLSALIEDAKSARKELNAGAIKRLAAKVQALSANALAHERYAKISKATINSAIQEATKALREEARTDLDIAALQGRISQLTEMEESTLAMQQVLGDIVAIVGSTPRGRTALFTGQGGARAIIGNYKDMKRLTGQTLHNERLLDWAAYLLSKSPDLRDAFQAAHLSKNTGLRAQLQGFQKQFADALSKNPNQAIRKAVRDVAAAQADYTGAEFLFRQYQKRLLKEMNPILRRLDNGDVAQNFLNDPDFIAYRNEVLQDGRSLGGKPAMPLRSADDTASSIIVGPISGNQVGIGFETLPANQAQMTKRYREFRALEDEMDGWLFDPANADDPRRGKIEMDLRMLRAYYATHSLLRPEAREENGPAFTVPMMVADKSGSRMAGQVRTALRQLDRMQYLSRNWFNNWAFKLTAQQATAMRSHGIKWGLLTGMSQREATNRYVERVFRELFGRWQYQQRGPQVGDVLSSGEVVTAEDMLVLRQQKTATFAGIKSIDLHNVQFTEDKTGLNTPNYRKIIESTEYQVPRTFNADLRSPATVVSDSYAYLLEEAAKSPPNPTAISDAKTALEQSIDAMWPAIGRAMLTDRNSKFSEKTIFDGVNGAFDLVAEQMMLAPDQVQTIDALSDWLSQYSTATQDEAKNVVLGEFGRIIKQWSDVANEPAAGAPGGATAESKNSFTQARGWELAPWVFYDTGFQNTDDVQLFAVNMMSRAMDNVENGFQALAKDLDRQEGALKLKVTTLEGQGVKNPKKTALRQNKVEQINGQTYDEWTDLRGRKAMVDGILKNLRNSDAIGSDFDFNFDRTANTVVGLLIGKFGTAIRNISGAYMGWKLWSIGYKLHVAALRTLQFNTPEIIKIFGSLNLSAFKAFGYFIRGAARGLSPFAHGRFSEAYRLAMRDVIREFSQTSMLRIQSIKDMVDAGVMFLPDKVAEFDNQMDIGILTRGRLTDYVPEGFWGTFYNYALAVVESTILPIVTAPFPIAGDAAVNAGMRKFVQHKVGPVRAMEQRLRTLYAEIKNGAPRKLDLEHPNSEVNRFSHQELAMTPDGLSKLRLFYQSIALSLDQEIIRFFAQLEARNPDAQFLTDEQRNSVADQLINRMNRGTFGNSPLAMMNKNIFVKIVRPLYGFNSRQFAAMFSEFSIPKFVEGATPITEADLPKRAVVQYTRLMGGLLLMVLMVNLPFELREQYTQRMISRYYYNQESDRRFPWEEQTAGRRVAATGRIAMEAAPLVGAIVNQVIPPNSPARPSHEASVVVVEVAKDGLGYVSGAVQAGDPRYGLGEFISRLVGDSKIVMNRLPAYSGRRMSANAVNEIKRYADYDLVRPPYRGGAMPNVTEMAPWVQRMENAAMNDRTAQFMQYHQEAVAAARRAGKADPEKTIQNAFRSRNPFGPRSLEKKMTPSERQQMLKRADSGLGPDLSKDILEAERLWEKHANMIGIGMGRESSASSFSQRRPLSTRPQSLRRTPSSFYRPRQQRRRY